MNMNPQIYHGEWWLPAKADPSNSIFLTLPEGGERKYTGTLTYNGEKDSTLELIHVPSGYHYSHYEYNKVLWGKDSNDNIFTLFNVAMREKRGRDFSCVTYVVGMILIGEHVLSLSEAWTKKCVVYFPYLNNWLFDETQYYIKSFYSENSFLLQSECNNRILLEVNTKDGTWLRLYYNNTVEHNIEGYNVKRMPYFAIEASTPKSIEYFFKIIGEFEQFLSIALYCEQSLSAIEFAGRNTKQNCRLLIKREPSINPYFSSLIKYVQLKEKLPDMFAIWHENFDKIAPISRYLIDSLHRKHAFDVPDFLIIAQALDGYHKRFVNKKDGKDHKKYEDGIRILLEQFEDVDCVQKCNIDPTILRDSRNFYSHLCPDEEKKSAVDNADLYWLTEKCKILLTCCILNMLGLTNEEINLCCEHSPISQIIDSLPLEID